MSFWNDAKRGAGFGLGAGFTSRLSWELGGLAWRLLRRLALALAIIVYAAAQSCQTPATPAPEKPKAVQQKKSQNNDNSRKNPASAH